MDEVFVLSHQYEGVFYIIPVHIINYLYRVTMNSFVNYGLSLHLAICQLVTMPALLPPFAQPSAKEILRIS